MSIFSLFTFIGGLTLFLFGMNVMGDSLTRVSGGKLEYILEKLTSNTFKGVFLGLAVTAVIQSSSATTVMVVGFVNSGIMRLSQAVGIIMGANVGTTVTSWILSLTGIESDNFFISLLKPSSFAPVLGIIGMVLLMVAKNEKRKEVGKILVGFSVLMMGMDIMSDTMEPLKDVPEFTNILLMFSNPIFGMLVGMAVTAIIQSSSASVGILQALCSTGAVTYGATIPIIMGQNIGTCITALLSSVGTSKNAKRAAMVHLYFNVIGTLVFMVGFYAINSFMDFGFLKESASKSGIALIHSGFNIAATVLLLPFAGVLEKLAYLTVREDEKELAEKRQKEDRKLKALDPRFLETPGLALEHAQKAVQKMSYICYDSLEKALKTLDYYTQDLADEVWELEETVDRYEDKLGTYLLQISNKGLSEVESKELNVLLHCIGDIERIGDHAANIVKSAKEMEDKKQRMSEKANTEIKILGEACLEIFDLSIKAMKESDREIALEIEPLEETVDDLTDRIKDNHVERLRQGNCSIEMGFVLTDLTTNLERISDHCSNIGVTILETDVNSPGRHAYMDLVKQGEFSSFRERYEFYKQKYRIPDN
ncbi:phosphate:Na+ symporter [Acetitomaculum ruminis DSM 5522]|uniref:Phosphate:Na+ symporter n=1 Tax=Acetitomaculum ruminis DSM 5522 TaxID=1120918 RepID=A0A1I0WJU0_9FIRM|nr:Na/Pi cotransporter family protein [Acetitomaculum ruminis]SFA88901.1 phosphate:Na+ symporter [Acetitomaculum ruminis DSM 5522]